MNLIQQLWHEAGAHNGRKFLEDLQKNYDYTIDPKTIEMKHFKSCEDVGIVFLEKEPVAVVKIDYAEPCLIFTML